MSFRYFFKEIGTNQDIIGSIRTPDFLKGHQYIFCDPEFYPDCGNNNPLPFEYYFALWGDKIDSTFPPEIGPFFSNITLDVIYWYLPKTKSEKGDPYAYARTFFLGNQTDDAQYTDDNPILSVEPADYWEEDKSGKTKRAATSKGGVTITAKPTINGYSFQEWSLIWGNKNDVEFDGANYSVKKGISSYAMAIYKRDSIELVDLGKIIQKLDELLRNFLKPGTPVADFLSFMELLPKASLHIQYPEERLETMTEDKLSAILKNLEGLSVEEAQRILRQVRGQITRLKAAEQMLQSIKLEKKK